VPATTPNTEIRERNAAAEPRSGRARWIRAQGPERLKRLIVVVSFVECDVRAASLYAPDTLPIMLGELAFMPGSISEEMGPRLPHRELAVQRLTPSYRI
jgi:hypothetical protein